MIMDSDGIRAITEISYITSGLIEAIAFRNHELHGADERISIDDETKKLIEKVVYHVKHTYDVAAYNSTLQENKKALQTMQESYSQLLEKLSERPRLAHGLTRTEPIDTEDITSRLIGLEKIQDVNLAVRNLVKTYIAYSDKIAPNNSIV